MVVATYIQIIITVLLLINVKRLNDPRLLNVTILNALLNIYSNRNKNISKILIIE